MATSGAELVRQMAAGDREAFALFYDRYAPVVFPLILRIVRERADASDVLQEVFWEAWRTADAYDPTRGSPEAWMVTRARTRAIDRIRSTRRRSEMFVAPLDEAIAATPGPPAPDAAERAEDRGTIRSALDRLAGARSARRRCARPPRRWRRWCARDPRWSRHRRSRKRSCAGSRRRPPRGAPRRARGRSSGRWGCSSR